MAAFISLATPPILSLVTPPFRTASAVVRLPKELPIPARALQGAVYRAQAGRPRRSFYPNPAEEEPPEVSEDDEANLSRFDRVETEAARARKKQQEEYERDKHVFLSAIGLDEDDPAVDHEEGPEIVRLGRHEDESDFFTEVDKAIALRRKELIKDGTLKNGPGKKIAEVEDIDELEPEEVLDLDEIRELEGITVMKPAVSEDDDEEEEEDGKETDEEDENPIPDASFDLDLSGIELADSQAWREIIETFKMPDKLEGYETWRRHHGF